MRGICDTKIRFFSKKLIKAVFSTGFGIIERSDRLRSNTEIDYISPNPACRLRRPYGANIKRHGFAVIKQK